jgi:hypothetical protein
MLITKPVTTVGRSSGKATDIFIGFYRKSVFIDRVSVTLSIKFHENSTGDRRFVGRGRS